MTRLLVAGWTGTANLGDELLFRAFVAMARERELDVTAVSADPSATTATHGVRSVGRGLRLDLDPYDGLVFGPGGLLQDETSWLSLPNHLWRVRAANRRSLPVAGIGLGAGPLTTRWGRRLVRRTLSPAVGLAVRDQPSAGLLRAVGLTNVVAAADLAFRLPPPVDAPEDRIVACLRPYAGKGRVLPARFRDRRTVDDDLVSALATALDQLPLPVHFVAFEAGRDNRFHAAVAERMTSATTSVVPDLDAVLGEVARSRAVVATRFHGGVAAALAGRPVVLLGYAPKVTGLGVDLDMPVLPYTPAGVARIPVLLDEVLARDLTEARERLAARAAGNDGVLDRLTA